MRYFDFDSAARAAGLGPEAVRELCDSIRKEFPRDDMMYELHVLRACMAIRDGDAGLKEMLGEETAPRAETSESHRSR